MGEIKIVVLMTALFFLGAIRAAPEECGRFQDATPDELVSFLNGIEPDQGNAQCITFAINELGRRRYEAAISVLTNLLAFRRPLDSREKQGLYLHIQSIDQIYPAASALEEIGKKALPSLLQVMKAASSSARERENAVFVWMEIYKAESPKGVALLKQEVDRADDAAVRGNLQWALGKAQTWCNPPDQKDCKAALQTGNH